jgi:hypothetical protein
MLADFRHFFIFFRPQFFFAPQFIFPRISRPGSASLAEQLPVGPAVINPELRTSLGTPNTTGKHNFPFSHFG